MTKSLFAFAAVLLLGGLASAQTATVTKYGSGSSTVKGDPFLPLANFARSYPDSRGYPRGYYFKAPTQFVVTGLKVKNETNATHQTVALFVLPIEPPTYASTYVTKAADVLFFASDQPSGKIVTFPPKVIRKDQWVGVLGVCNDGSSQSVTSSYTSGPMNMSVLGKPFVAKRFLMQEILRDKTKQAVGQGVSSEGTGTGPCGRVEIHVAGQSAQGPSPTLDTIGLPRINSTATLNLVGVIKTVQVGILGLGAGRLPGIPTPYGNLNVTLPFVLVVPVATGTGKVPLAIPNDNNLLNIKLNWQGVVFDLTTPIYGMTEGNEWLIGT